MFEDEMLDATYEDRYQDWQFADGGASEQEPDEWEDDCPLDGDAESALASAGHGMDEDYEHGSEGW